MLCHTGEVLAAGSQTPASEEWTPQGGECCCSRKARAIKNVIRKVPGWNLSGTAGFTPRRTGDIREACGVLFAHIPVGCLAIVDSRQTVSCEIDPGWSPSVYRSPGRITLISQPTLPSGLPARSGRRFCSRSCSGVGIVAVGSLKLQQASSASY